MAPGPDGARLCLIRQSASMILTFGVGDLAAGTDQARKLAFRFQIDSACRCSTERQ